MDINSGKNRLVVYPLCEYAVTVEFGSTADEQTLARINIFDALLKKNAFPGFYQTVPAYTTLSVFFEADVVARQRDMHGNNCFEKVRDYLLQLNTEEKGTALSAAGEPILIPVYYGDEHGPDLEYVAKAKSLTPSAIIKLHSEATYKVFMIGFIPGFAYLGELNPLLAIPRKGTPVKVQPGAVGITGTQTCIYPLETPGGWHIIGQTPVRMFDPNRPRPALLKAGDLVRFEPISLADFEKYKRG